MGHVQTPQIENKRTHRRIIQSHVREGLQVLIRPKYPRHLTLDFGYQIVVKASTRHFYVSLQNGGIHGPYGADADQTQVTPAVQQPAEYALVKAFSPILPAEIGGIGRG
jgi:hypothetical protein